MGRQAIPFLVAAGGFDEALSERQGALRQRSLGRPRVGRLHAQTQLRPRDHQSDAAKAARQRRLPIESLSNDRIQEAKV